MTYKINRILFFSIVCFIYFFSWKMQGNLLLNGDVSWLSYTAKNLIHGGQYGTSFFETNPPLIIYLYIPLLFIHHIFHLSETLSLRIYIFTISTVSLFCCYILLKKILPEKSFFPRILIIALMCGLFLIVPVCEFGQREHITVMLCTPYYFLLGMRLKKIVIKSKLEIIIGIMAGIGFALKPYFYLPFLLAEIFYSYHQRSIFSFRRTECYLIGLIGCIYLSIIILFNYNYISIIIPLIEHSYYPKYQQPLKSILLNDQSIYGYFLLIFYYFFYKKISYPQLTQTLLIAFLGFWLVFLWQRMGWLYHALPFYIYEILIYFLLYLALIMNQQLTKLDYLKLGLFNILLAGFYFIHMPYISLSIYYFPDMIFLLFGGIFFIFFYIFYEKNHFFSLLMTLLIIYICNIVFYYYVSITVFSRYLLFLSVLMWFLSFLLLIPKKKWHYGLLALSGILIFAFPFYKISYTQDYSHYYKKLYQHMIIDARYFSHEKVYFFSAASELIFPLIDYAKLNYVSRFWSMVWLPLMKEPMNIGGYDHFYKTHRVELDFYINCIIQDIIYKKPNFIFVDIRGKGYFFNIPINYIYLFSKNPAFKKQWGHYHLVRIIDFPPLYKFAIYAS